MGQRLEEPGNGGPLLPEELRTRPIRLALSGGGFRATLFSLGAVLYLVDSGQNRAVRSIASVSGASVLNALLAQAGDFGKMTIADIDRVAARAVATITTTGLLRASLLTSIYMAALGLGAFYLGVEALFRWPIGLAWWQLVLGFFVVGALALLRGTLIVRMMANRFFAGESGPPRLGDLETTVTHHLCSTDLNSASRAHFTMGGGNEPTFTVKQLGSGAVPRFRLDHAVRASAAFPGGIPPKRVALADVGLAWKSVTHHVAPALKLMRKRRPASLALRLRTRLRRLLRLDGARIIYLTDGGVFNNLATDVDEEDDMVLVVDASAPLSSVPLRHLAFPGLAEFGSLMRSMSVLYNNTVDPRIEHLQDRAALILRSDVDPEDGGVASDGGFPVIVRITDNTTKGLRRMYAVLARAGRPLHRERREAVSSAVGPVWDSAAEYVRTQYGLGPFAADSPDVPTTFDRIARPVALMLMLHGYLATMFSLGAARGCGVGPVDVERFERLLRGEIGDQPGFTPGAAILVAFGGEETDVL